MESDKTFEDFSRVVDNDSLWLPKRKSFDVWLNALTRALLTSGAVSDPLLQLLEPVCRVCAHFSHRVLPFIVHNILTTATLEHKNLLSHKFNRFFTAATDTSDDVTRRKCVRAMLDVVQYLRHQPRVSSA